MNELKCETRGNRETRATPWPGGSALVRVTCEPRGNVHWGGALSVLEFREARADGVLTDWQPVERFARDTELAITLPPGEIRLRLLVPDGMLRHWTLSIDPSRSRTKAA